MGSRHGGKSGLGRSWSERRCTGGGKCSGQVCVWISWVPAAGKGRQRGSVFHHEDVVDPHYVRGDNKSAVGLSGCTTSFQFAWFPLPAHHHRRHWRTVLYTRKMENWSCDCSGGDAINVRAQRGWHGMPW